MTKVLILGANGKIARRATQIYLDSTNNSLRLYLRRPERLRDIDNKLVEIVGGDTTDEKTLVESMKDVDVVYANLAGGNIEQQAKAVVEAMHATGVKRLIWISTLGIYDEVPGKFGEWNNSTLGSYITTYAAAAKVVEDSDLEYTIIRPAWLTDKDEVDYETTQKDETFKGTEVSRKSIAQLVVDITQAPDKFNRESVGVDKPGTDGDKPAWY
ncbi:SDR family oxidoreductase [Companilactobacillus allii]|uniref:NAD-dependent dehydratase n=1 Tax=Companilactobacillus allii TaxID=1847728 RepID=A0A1P8Q0M6_9LACO|nr:SDR family oxidoreductase [Companilactobacillus allii]APX71424.1 NAD-dependent dehydratase [Companilactobacillus allii]USQ68505.1 SDR family oxidoreductase [Companilactobacillus allii]